MIEFEGALKPLHVDDVTDDEEGLQKALRLVALGYRRHSSHDLHVEEVHRELCEDVYLEAGRSRTLLATGFNPNTGRVEPLATGRVVLGGPLGDEARLPLELVSLVEPRAGWSGFRLDGCSAEAAAEVSRFAISPMCTAGLARQYGLPLFLMRRLAEAFELVAAQHGRRHMWALMPPVVARAVAAAGFELTKVEVRLKRDENAALFDRFDRYWLRSPPALYRYRASADASLEPPPMVAHRSARSGRAASSVVEAV